MHEIDPRLGKQLDVDDCIEIAVSEDCTCGLAGVVPTVNYEPHALDCPVSLRGPLTGRRNDPGKPLSAEDVVRRKLEGK